MRKFLIKLTLLVAVGLLLSEVAQADLAWSMEINSNPNTGTLAIDNQSTGMFANYSIKSINFDFTKKAGAGTGAVNFNALAPGVALDGLGTKANGTVVSDAGFIKFGSPTGTTAANDIPTIENVIGSAGQLFTFNFAFGTFSSGEGFGLTNLDIDNGTFGVKAARRDVEGATITVTYWGNTMGDFTPTLSATYGSGGGGGSMPLSASMAVPEPTNLILLGLVVGVGYCRRRR